MFHFRKWRTIDIVSAAVLGVACGILFLVWNQIGYAAYGALNALTPGIGGLVSGIWYMGGPLGALIIRRPGAALFVETVAAFVSMSIGSQWGVETILSGFLQGFGAEIIFALFAYRNFSLLTSMLAGATAGAAAWVMEGITHGNFAKSATFLVTYGTSTLISGAVLAGLVPWLLYRALARSGALNELGSTHAKRDRQPETKQERQSHK